MYRIIILIFSLIASSYASCICCGSISCIPVNISLSASTTNSKSGISQKDLDMAQNWSTNTNIKLKEIDSIESQILNMKGQAFNLKEAMIISKFKQNYYNKLINSNNDKKLNLLKNKLILLNNKLKVLSNAK